MPKSFKRGLVNCLLYRAWKICSTYLLFHQEITFIKNILLSNGYPETFLDSCINKFVASKVEKKSVTADPVFGPDKKRVVVTLPYCGVYSDKLKRQLKRMYAVVAPWIDLCIVFKPSFKLGHHRKLKDHFHKKKQEYKVYCTKLTVHSVMNVTLEWHAVL